MALCTLVVGGSVWFILPVLLPRFDIQDGHDFTKAFRTLYFQVMLYALFVFKLIINVSYIVHLILLIVDLRKGNVMCMVYNGV
ncbi:hypothetical protein BDQ17DRAFT_148193 [Cyathus striatus]|nr:hypothetical protein BDQ17DRAFT_148193 [Cyathus striatus]